MAKITRKRLARGTKLTQDHVQVPLKSAVDQINAGTIEHEQLESPNGSFRINLHIPYLASDYPFSSNALAAPNNTMMEYASYCIPFTLPPTQEMFSAAANSTFNISESQPYLVLDEVSFSFDQRAEPCAIKDQMQDDLDVEAFTASGTMDFDSISAYDLNIGIVEKPQEYFEDQTPVFEKSLFNAPLKSSNFSGDIVRFNPVAITDVNVSISPFKTYAPALGQTPNKTITGSKSHALVSVQISMKIKSTLMQRDVYSDPSNLLQNYPTKDSHLARRYRSSIGQSLSATLPAAGDSILADTGATTSAVSTLMATVDDEFRHKLSGGIDSNCEADPRQDLIDDASYEVIAVPLMNNRRFGGVTSRWAGEEPYTGTHATVGGVKYWTDPVWDRRIIPIHYPMMVHHVVLAWNWNRFYVADQSGAGNATAALSVPTSNTFTVDVGVGIGEGLRSDQFNLQTIASLQMVNPANPHQPAATWSGKMFDRCNANAKEFFVGGVSFQGNGAVRAAPSTTGNFNWEWEMHQVPLTGTGGTGYFAQGKPVFVGKSWTPTVARTNVGGGASSVGGREQFLEVRMKISDSSSANTKFNSTRDDVVSGYGGHWVYIIGKKFLTR
jgi:hypothetical protein